LKRDLILFVERFRKNIPSYQSEEELQVLFEKVDRHIALINAGKYPAKGMYIHPTIKIVDDKSTVTRINLMPERWIIDFEKPPIDEITLRAEFVEVLDFTEYQKDI